VILLDTSTLLWLERGHARARDLERHPGRLYVSPASLLEVQFLLETGRVRLRTARSVADLEDDPRWLVDDPPAAAWFSEARGVGWTRDPFDRLLVAHAELRGWRFATADGVILDHLDPGRVVEV